MKQPRVSIAGKIIIDEKREPKPSPDKYQVEKSWLYKEPKIRGNYKNMDARTTYTDGFIGIKKLNNVPPVGRYNEISIDLYKTRSSHFEIKHDTTDGFRTKPIQKQNSPSPLTYKVHESFQKT